MTVKPKLGRPATGRDPLVGVRLPATTLAQIDAWAAGHKTTRSKTIRGLIDAAIQIGGLSDEPAQPPRPAPPTKSAPKVEKVAPGAPSASGHTVQVGPSPVIPGSRLKKR